jgi:DNA replication protein DnaC
MRLFGGKSDMRIEVCEEHGEYVSERIFSKTWTTCPMCRAFADARREIEEQQREQQKRVAQWQRKLGSTCIPERFTECSLNTSSATTDEQRHVLDFAREYVARWHEMRARGTSLIFIGRPGTGKTHLAVAIAMDVMRKYNASVLYTTALGAVRRIKDTWHPASDITETQAIEQLVFPDLLILDEVGVQFGSDTEKLLLFEVLDGRYQHRRPTIFASNLTIQELETYLGERVMDRLREDGARWFAFDWPSHRIPPKSPPRPEAHAVKS